jgi:hypothetical protein
LLSIIVASMGPIARAITFDSPCRRHLADVSVDISTRRTQAATRDSRRPLVVAPTHKSNALLTMRPNKQKWQDDGPVAICAAAGSCCFAQMMTIALLIATYRSSGVRRGGPQICFQGKTSSRWCHHQSSICLNKRLVAPPFKVRSVAGR